MDKAEFLRWAKSWVSNPYTGTHTVEEVAAYDQKAADMYAKVKTSCDDLTAYFKTKMADTH